MSRLPLELAQDVGQIVELTRVQPTQIDVVAALQTVEPGRGRQEVQAQRHHDEDARVPARRRGQVGIRVGPSEPPLGRPREAVVVVDVEAATLAAIDLGDEGRRIDQERGRRGRVQPHVRAEQVRHGQRGEYRGGEAGGKATPRGESRHGGGRHGESHRQDRNVRRPPAAADGRQEAAGKQEPGEGRMPCGPPTADRGNAQARRQREEKGHDQERLRRVAEDAQGRDECDQQRVHGAVRSHRHREGAGRAGEQQRGAPPHPLPEQTRDRQGQHHRAEVQRVEEGGSRAAVEKRPRAGLRRHAAGIERGHEPQESRGGNRPGGADVLRQVAPSRAGQHIGGGPPRDRGQPARRARTRRRVPRGCAPRAGGQHSFPRAGRGPTRTPGRASSRRRPPIPPGPGDRRPPRETCPW